MGYKKVKDVLPNDLIIKIQEYIDGEYIYIPKRETKDRHKRKINAEKIIRDKEIYERYKSGYKVQQLAEEYFISTQGIYKIIAKQKG